VQLRDLTQGNMIKPPLSIAAQLPRNTGHQTHDTAELWAADLAVSRGGHCSMIFHDVLFVEARTGTRRAAYIYGIESPTGQPTNMPEGLSPSRVAEQQRVIEYLRTETQVEAHQMGAFANICHGIAYTAEAQATAAYIVQRCVDLDIAVGYKDDADAYHLLCLQDDESGFLVDARMVIPFDQMSKCTPAAAEGLHGRQSHFPAVQT
jgi:hypothetical protein